MIETKNWNWYVIRTQNNKEKSVLEKLKMELSRNGLENIVKKSIIPTEKVFSVKNGKKIHKEKIIYPGYLFIETLAVGEISNLLKRINGASGFVKTKSGDINPLKDYEVKRMITDQEYNDTVVTEYTGYSIGEKVNIINGPFSSFKGVVSSVDNEKSKIKVEVLVFSRATEVELDFIQIERDV